MKSNEFNEIERDNTMKISTKTMNYITYILIVVLVALLAWSSVSERISEHKQIKRINNLNQEKSTLVQELSNLKRDYQMVKSLEKEQEEQITEDQNRIDQLIREVKFKSDDIEAYRAEVSGLQKKLETYLTTVDSLEITLEIQEKTSREKIDSLVSVRDSLAGMIKQTSRLHAYNLDVRVENRRGKLTIRPNQVDKVNICFTLAENIFLEKGKKNLYLRILRPDERLIYKSKDYLFIDNDQELAYTGKVDVNYENVDTRVCITWANIEEDLEEGLYYVNVYTDGYEIGSRSFLLDKGFLFF